MGNLKAQIEEAKARRDKALGAISEDDKAEIADREQLAKFRAEEHDALETAKRLDLDRREEAARAIWGQHVEGVMPEHREDTFIVRDPGPAAYTAYMAKLTKLVGKDKDMLQLHLEYAAASVVDFNGMTDMNAMAPDGKNAVGYLLGKYLSENKPVAVLLAGVAQKLGGGSAADRKSSG